MEISVNGQGLNRYAYVEGNPVSLVDPFGLSPENTQEPNALLHSTLDVIGFVFDGTDIINGIVYAMEGNYTQAALCMVSLIPVAGSVIAGAAKGAKAVIAAKKAEKIASLALESTRMTFKAADKLDALADATKLVQKYGDDVLKSAYNIADALSPTALKALEKGEDVAKEAKAIAKEAEAAGAIKLSTKADEVADAVKGSLNSYGKYKSEWLSPKVM